MKPKKFAMGAWGNQAIEGKINRMSLLKRIGASRGIQLTRAGSAKRNQSIEKPNTDPTGINILRRTAQACATDVMAKIFNVKSYKYKMHRY